jgi:hypothetical protein
MRRSVFSATLTFLLAMPLLASDDGCLPSEQPRASRRAQIDAVFSRPAPEVTETKAGVMMTGSIAEVLVARINDDGRLVIECVDSAPAAIRFLEPPAERVPSKQAAEK